MTMRLITERETELLEAAWRSREAIDSQQHAADVAEQTRLMVELETVRHRVAQRLEAHTKAMDALRDFHRSQVETGAEPPADNTEAKAVIENETTVDVEKYFRPIFGAEDVNEFSSSRANGAYTED